MADLYDMESQDWSADLTDGPGDDQNIANGNGNDSVINGISKNKNINLTGKSGRVIERLMAENDRLRRELKSETAKREEEQKRGEAARLARDSLQSMNDNLVHQTTIDKTSLTRKERKIEELKADREEDKAKRIEAESNLKKYAADTESSLQTMRETLSKEQEEKERAHRQYEVLQQSWKHLEEGYKSGVARLRKQVEEMRQERMRERASMQKLELVVEQQRQELDKMRGAWLKVGQTYDERLAVAEKALKEIKLINERDSGDTEELREEAKRNADQLRYLLKVRQAFRDDKD